MNIFLAFIILISETRNPKFNKWFKNYLKPVAIITVFSSGDVKLLHIFDSNYGGFKIFSAPFSSLALKLIFWGGFLNTIVEDLPQLIIQILFATYYPNSYDITAFFTLITSILVLLVSIIECSYHLFINNKNQNQVEIKPEYNEIDTIEVGK
ncbi:hypothetical protein C1645_812263 [Glomus cerebriforme]|uniref:Uncharacterized protein n=1 Tax=Glomus cerebriforme TaxID=658196 RepID=A0A397TV72_9GLOM|nr:hypothetical protein C1645_812263 [Glomus cerebriforme]